MPVPQGDITSTDNFDQTKVEVKEDKDDLLDMQDSGGVQPPAQDEGR